MALNRAPPFTKKAPTKAPQYYGRVLVKGKLTPDKEIWWCPGPKDMTLATTLMKMSEMKPIFMMRIGPSPTDASSMMLQPIGVVWYNTTLVFNPGKRFSKEKEIACVRSSTPHLT